MIKLLQALKDIGITAIIAGGAVRDQVRGVEPNDIDVWCLGDTDSIDIVMLMSLLTNSIGHDLTPDSTIYGNVANEYEVRLLVKGEYKDAKGKCRKVDIIVPSQHFYSPIELVSNFDYNVNQGFIGLDCGVYKPDLTRLYAVRPERQTSERTERFQAMVDYYNQQQEAASAFKAKDDAWLEDN